MADMNTFIHQMAVRKIFIHQMVDTNFYTEHCSVGPTNFIETIGTARLKIRDYRYGTAEDFSTARLKISDEDFG